MEEQTRVELSIVVPAMNEEENIAQLIPRAWRVLGRIGCTAEIIVVVGPSRDGTSTTARACGARVIEQRSRGYGGALAEGFAAAKGEYVLTMDADLSHAPVFIATLWAARQTADLLIASRYVRGGRAVMPRFRLIMSRILNSSFPFILSLPLKDMSSGFRLYRRSVLQRLEITGTNFDVLQDLLLQAYADGWRVREVPFAYQPRGAGRSKASLFGFAKSYLHTLGRMWSTRNSIECADYDERAYDSRIPLQRWWQRRRYRIILSMAQNHVGTQILDVGCGSSRILVDLPGAVGLDIRHHKLRYMRRYGTNPLITGSIFTMPFRDAQFDCVICSEVIEHIPKDPSPIAQLLRVLRPDGLLILGTPDYSTRAWNAFERAYGFFAPHGYADEHITHYTRESMIAELATFGWVCTDLRYVFGSEMIGAFQRDVRHTAGSSASRIREMQPITAS
jgi:dolichol-phosphate mannosyltransferase